MLAYMPLKGYADNQMKAITNRIAAGGIISPTLSNMAIDGLEEVVLRAVPRRNRVNFIRYADGRFHRYSQI